ncbi:uncharacterized protein LOC110640337 isoform X2 [Hevea brasiliensis]|uniref:uncharacterized protein LOC110640337 isoform X2 n=1 Tax=Hevea brasiliensis TaxID=3981 RepID=UPI000B76E4EF|nr:uncharacterized protein LOC110640337 isoform X2 [Hevea brasiliensis]XP_057993358.1 uncharacterized protein LOC110640337 isoform X2 [Hevea brasiliensis]
MLQWMGGSRKKVTTSRKSIQKRQKKYFEQRRRQMHQQTAGLESSVGGEHKCLENYKEHRSLDVLNLLSFSASSQNCKSSCPSGREDPIVNGSTVKNHVTADPSAIRASTICPVDSYEIREASSLSGSQVETVSTKKVLLGSSHDHSNAFNGTNNKQDFWGKATQQQLSFFDLLGDDESNRNLEGTPEAHVAFSVDGLGKVGTKTPPHSPRQPDRYVTYGCSSPFKAVRQLNSSRNLNCVLNDLELEVDAIIQDIEMPIVGGSIEFSTLIEDSCGKLKKNLSEVRDHMQLGGQGSKVRSTFSIGKAFCNTGNDNEDLWDARSGLLDGNFLHERQCDMSWKGWQCHPDGDSVDFLKYGNDEIPNHAFGRPYQMKKRDCMKATKRFNLLDSSAQNHQTSENDYNFLTLKETRRHLLGIDFDFGDVTAHPDWSCFVLEDAKESLSLLSEESCSSTAVRGEESDISKVNSKARDNRRQQNAFVGPDIKHGDKSILAKEKHFKNKDDLQKGSNAHWSGKCTQMPTLLKAQSTHNLIYLSQGKIGQHGSWLFQEGYSSAHMDLDYSSVCQTSKTKLPSSGSKPFNEDTFDIFPVPEPHIEAKFSLGRSKHGSPFKSSPHGGCISENYAFFQQSCQKHSNASSTLSNFENGATKPDIFPESSDFELESRPPHSSQDAVSEGEKLIFDLSALRSMSKDKKNRTESQQANHDNIKPQKEIFTGKNLKVKYSLDSEEAGPMCKELKDGTSETSSSAKISDKSESSVDGRTSP